MAIYVTAEPSTPGVCRYIVRIPASNLPNGPAAPDIRNNTGSIESCDIFGMADGTTRAKHYSNMRLKDWSDTAACNPGPYVVRTSSPEISMPAYRWTDVNNGFVAQFPLTSNQLVASTIQIGITAVFANARPKIDINSWSYPNLGPSDQPDTHALTVGLTRKITPPIPSMSRPVRSLLGSIR